jgi:small subunit ribosomal protein S21
VSDLVAGWEVRKLAEVRLQEGESLENALRRFKRKVQQEDIVKEVKRHSFYLKPGEKKRACRKPWRESVLERKAGKNRIELRSKAAAAKQRPSACERTSATCDAIIRSTTAICLLLLLVCSDFRSLQLE